jgi:hypothetical protein
MQLSCSTQEVTAAPIKSYGKAVNGLIGGFVCRNFGCPIPAICTIEKFFRATGIDPTDNDTAVIDLQLPKLEGYENQDDGDSLANAIAVVDCHVGIGGELDCLSDGASEETKAACPVHSLYQRCDNQACLTRAASNVMVPIPHR